MSYSSFADNYDYATMVDPVNCGCTDCLMGSSKPLGSAGPELLVDMLNGDAINRGVTAHDIDIVAENGNMVALGFRDTNLVLVGTLTQDGFIAWSSDGYYRDSYELNQLFEESNPLNRKIIHILNQTFPPLNGY